MRSAASIRARLLNVSKQSGDEFQTVLTRFAVERLLYRLSVSEEKNSFILKGAMLFLAWQGVLHRPTKDVDLLGYGSSNIDEVAERIRSIVQVPADDGIIFEPDSVRVAVIKEDAEYEGVRVNLIAGLEQARISLQIDVGFGDAVDPEPLTGTFPAILPELGNPVLRLYPPEVVVAEKLHAMVVLDLANSRMKDFYDIWYLSRTGIFTAQAIRLAVETTFERRRTPVPDKIPFALTNGFLQNESKLQQWRGFLKRLRLEKQTPGLPIVGSVIEQFLHIVWTDVSGDLSWSGGGPWRK